jgi:hypothetical protein
VITEAKKSAVDGMEAKDKSLKIQEAAEMNIARRERTVARGGALQKRRQSWITG